MDRQAMTEHNLRVHSISAYFLNKNFFFKYYAFILIIIFIIIFI